MKTVNARLDIEVFVDCPECDYMIDLLREDETAGYDHNEEGQVLTQACPNGYWSDAHKEFEVNNVECTQCGTKFNVRELEW